MKKGLLVKIEDIGPLATVIQGGRNMVKLELEGEQFWMLMSLLRVIKEEVLL